MNHLAGVKGTIAHASSLACNHRMRSALHPSPLSMIPATPPPPDTFQRGMENVGWRMANGERRMQNESRDGVGGMCVIDQGVGRWALGVLRRGC